MRQYYVYIMTNQKRTLYTGVTNDLIRRVYEHKQKSVEGFTKRYNLSWLAYYETTDNIESAIQRKADQGVVATQEGSADRVWKSPMG